MIRKQSPKEIDPLNDFVVVLRAASYALFPFYDGGMKIQLPSRTGLVWYTVNTVYTDRGLGAPIPHGLEIIAEGKASSIKEAIEGFHDPGAFLLDLLALTTNTGVHQCDVMLAFDNSPEKKEHEFWQARTSEEPFDVQRRKVNVPEIFSTLKALKAHPEENEQRIHRAITHYNQAILNWRPGHEIIVLAFLWMAIEALTKVILRQQLAAAKIQNDADLASHFNIPLTGLDAYVRKTFIFKGDESRYKQASRVSNELEHAYETFPKIYKNAAKACVDTANYVRTAIFEAAFSDATVPATLLGAPYDTPLGWQQAPFVTGKLIGEAGKLASPGELYPFLELHATPSGTIVDDDGNTILLMIEGGHPVIAEGTRFEPDEHFALKDSELTSPLSE